MIKKFITIFYIIYLSIVPLNVNASNEKLSIPRFATIKSNEVNARVGPAIKSPIEWVFVKKGEPIEIVSEFQQWRQIKDIKGEGGWVHSSVLSGKRSAIILGKEMLQLIKDPQDKILKVVAYVEPSVRCQLLKCKEEWCFLRCDNIKGWILRNTLWGIYKNEKI